MSQPTYPDGATPAEVLVEHARRIRALHAIISRPGLSFEEQIDESLRLGCRLLGCEVGKVGRQDPEQNASEFLNTIVTSELPARRGVVLPLDKTFCQITFDAQQTIAISHVAESGYRDHPAAQFLGMQSYIGCSINVHGRKFGTVNFSNRTPVATPFGETDKDFVSLIGSWISVMMERQLEAEQLRESKAKADAANQAKSEFLANMSHELRTPLNAIIGYSEMLEEDAEAAGLTPYAEDLRKIHRAGRHLLSLINDVLDISKVEAGRMELYVEEFDVQTLLDELIGTVQPLAQKSNNALVLEAAPDLGLMRSDHMRVRQVLLNLLSNACKFTDAGRITLRVSRERVRHEDWVQFEVTDSGIGMTPEQLTCAFEPFTQVNGSASRSHGGTGLGLAISRRFGEALGGQIEPHSAPGEGSTFVVRLPASVERVCPLEPAARAELHATAARLTREVGQERRTRVSRVLLIDDDRAVQDLVSRYLVRDGFEVLVASDGASGMQLARERRPQVVLLDVMMPGLDGWMVLKSFKANPDLCAIPVIMMTMLREKGLALSLGAADFVPKPIQWERLQTSLKQCVRRPRGRPVLLVESDSRMRAVLRTRLEAEGWGVVDAADGEAALRALDATPPAVVLLDLHMPDMDGFELLAALRARAGEAELPAIILTADELDAQAQARLRDTVQRIVHQDGTDVTAVLETVRELVNRQREADPSSTT